MIYCYMGLPGSGKSTQARALTRQLRGVVGSAGDWLRQHAQHGNQEIEELLMRSLPMPRELFERFLLDTFTTSIEAGRNLILDGSPRTREQVAAITEILGMKEIHSDLLGVVLQVRPSVALARLSRSERGRSDDSEGMLAARVRSHGVLLADTVSYFASLHPCIVMDGVGSKAQVTRKILEAISKSDQRYSRIKDGAERNEQLDET